MKLLSSESPGIRLLCPTRWTVRAAALSSISDNYSALRETWYVAKQKSSDSEMRAHIGSVAKQMETFDLFFGIELGSIVLNMADNLIKIIAELNYFSYRRSECNEYDRSHIADYQVRGVIS